MYCVFLGRAVATNAPGAGSVNTAAIAADAVTEAKIADDAVESEHLNNNVISGQTELASEPADTDEFLVSDAGTLKRIDYSLIKGGGITVADQFRVNAGIAFSSEQTVDTNWERIDTSGQGTLGSGMSESSGIFTFPSTGIYLVRFVMSAYKSGSTRYTINSIAVTTDNSNYTTIAQGYDSISQVDSSATYANSTAESLIDVTNTSNVKVKFLIQAQSGDAYLSTSSSVNRNTATFIRLGDT
jgi:hypothetical protein